MRNQRTGNMPMMKKVDRNRLQADQELDALLSTEAGRTEYWKILEAECGRSSLIELLESSMELDGDVIECGVFRGNSLRRISRTVKERAPGKQIFACDSFEGFPQDRIGSRDLGMFRFLFRVKKKFQVAQDVPSRLERFFAHYGVKGHVVKGFFSDTLPQLADRRYCFIHVDCDIYESHLDCLNILYDKLVPGGVVVFDDYHQAKWPGATQAVDEFFAGRTEKPTLLESRTQPAWYVRKPLVEA